MPHYYKLQLPKISKETCRLTQIIQIFNEMTQNEHWPGAQNDNDLTIKQLSIFAMTIPLPRHSGNLDQKFAPTPGLLHPIFQGDGDMLG